MMVTFVSQCEKNALKKTRRVLDAFANRIGDNTWQTIITEDGLLTVKKMLRKTASKNTAVSCHWIRSRSRSHFLWVVGNKQKFNELGIVPVNSTAIDKIRSSWENKWQHAHSIQVLATIAALLHDLGKATIGFQRKLDPKSRTVSGDPYRHEWISLKIFLAILVDCNNDKEWLERLTNLDTFLKEKPDWLSSIGQEKEKSELSKAPPLAQLVGWLVVTHHRLPFYDYEYWKKEVRCDLRKDQCLLESHIGEFYQDLKAVDHWVKNPKSIDERKDLENFWQLKAPIVVSKPWQKAVARWATKALHHSPLIQMTQQSISDPFIMHLARLSLMVGDHNFSSLSKEQSYAEVKGDSSLEAQLIANTDRKTALPKQALDQHLLGVAKFTAKFSRLLPQLSTHLPAIEKFEARSFNNRTNVKRFQWQNRSFDLALKLQEDTQTQGFFGVNMASTGCGKTLANARIMFALSDPNLGARFTIALGLRVLTLQTGNALRSKLNLDDSNLAVLIGSAASRKLFELNLPESSDESDELARMGSESLAEIVDEIVQFGDGGFDDAVLGTVIENPKARDLLFAPIVSCTIDHIISASENTRGGKHIAPMLRLLSSDLVLDEPDDFGQSDMPGLSRLVHLAGMFGSRVLLSSATLTPDLTCGLFSAYQAGRKIWNLQMGQANQSVVCAWFDEHNQTSVACSRSEEFLSSHNAFAEKRARKLNEAAVRRIAEILPINLPPAPESQRVHYEELSKILLDASNTLHHRYCEIQKSTGKTASVGLIRFANIGPIIELAKVIYQSPENSENVKDTQIHLCCYHARQLLVLRSALEEKLDRILTRSDFSSLFDHQEISEAVSGSDKTHHIFVVLATPVAEVGRDHDYDWAIIEPSSMRSIIQLAGRVWRHRPEKVAVEANIQIMEANIKALKHGKNLGVGSAVFCRPGFEDEETGFLLQTHKTSDLINSKQFAHINSNPRIVRPDPLAPTERLADLEHAVMANLLNNTKLNVVNAFWQENNGSRAGVHIQKISPFREQDRAQKDYVCLPDPQRESGFSFMVAEKAWESGGLAGTVNQSIRFSEFNTESEHVSPWLSESLSSALGSLSNKLGYDDLQEAALRYAKASLDDQDKGWNFNGLVGFWQGD